MNDVIKRNRMVLLFIAGLPVTVILLATWLWIYVIDGEINLVEIMGTANRGQLISPPLALREQSLRNAETETVELFTADDPRWRILVPGNGGCAESCQQVLHYTRQIHTAMGKYQNRIARVLLVDDVAAAQSFPADLAEQHPNLEVLYNAQQTSDWYFPLDGLPEGKKAAYYLVDPQGWVMMYYSADADGKDVMADLKFLLKNSNG